MTNREARPYRKGVGIVLFNRHGLVFVARRIDTPGDAWQLPQGGVEEGEKLRHAALRELKEEIGTADATILGISKGWLAYDLPPPLADRVWGGKFRGQRQRWFAFRFHGQDTDIDLQAHGQPEFDAWRWVEIDVLPSLAVEFKRELYRDLVDAFAPFAVPTEEGVEPQAPRNAVAR